MKSLPWHPALLGQLSGRLKEILRGYGYDPELYRARLAEIDRLERPEPKKAHALFARFRREIALQKHGELRKALTRPWLRTPPDLVGDETLRQIDREIIRFQRDAKLALAADRAMEDARALRSQLRERSLAPIDSLPAVDLDGLPEAAARAEGARRTAAQEMRNEARLQKVRSRAQKIRFGRVGIVSPSEVRTLSADALSARLDADEASLARAEKLDNARTAVTRVLRDPSVRDFLPSAGRALEERANALVEADDINGLRKLYDEAELVVQRAAEKASQGARARKHGTRAPGREKRPSDMQDMYG
ncbi:MAG: hypothetical protein ACYDDF_02995 [Thermoplasmatota archaeon]